MQKTITLFTLQSLDELDGHELAELQKYLISIERAPGGPYEYQGTLDDRILFNAKIYSLYLLSGLELPATRDYVEQHAAELSKTVRTAVQAYLSVSTKPRSSPIDALHSSIEKRLATTIPKPARRAIHPVIQGVIKTDARGEISNLTNTFQACLRPKFLRNPKTTSYGLANIYAWVSYSLYDAAIDETTSPYYLLAASLLARESYALYGHDTLAQKLFNRVDRAMIQEVHTRESIKVDNHTITFLKAPSATLLIKLLAERSIVHSAGPLCIVKAPHSEIRLLETALSHYCAARQLLDDIHDWKEDLLAGRYTYVIHHLAQKASLARHVPHPKEGVLETLQTIFWHTELEHLLRTVLERTSVGIQQLRSLEIFSNPEPFISLTIGAVQKNANAALQRHTQEKDYLGI